MTNTEHQTGMLLFSLNTLNVLAGCLKKQGLCTTSVVWISSFLSIPKVLIIDKFQVNLSKE